MDTFTLASVLSEARPDSGRDGHGAVMRTPAVADFVDLPNLDIAPYEPQAVGSMGSESILDNDVFVASLEALDQDLEDANDKRETRSHLQVEAVVGFTLSLSVGVVSWVLRAGSLFASLMSVLPLWRQFDPLPILGAAAVTSRVKHEQQEDAEKEDKSSAVETIFDQDESG
jgi:hypothetical protein